MQVDHAWVEAGGQGAQRCRRALGRSSLGRGGYRFNLGVAGEWRHKGPDPDEREVYEAVTG
jgi:hypothetical protein